MKEIRKLAAMDLRVLCIEKNWYTKGNNEEYGYLLFTLTDKESITTEDIVTIAKDIKEHSETDYEITDMCFEIATICFTYFED